MNNFAINICLIPEEKVYKLCEKLNSFDESNYNKNALKYIPHMTLVMKTLDEKSLKTIAEKISKLNLQKISAKSFGYKETKSENVFWNYLDIEKNQNIYKIQKEICEITISEKNFPKQKEDYLIDEIFTENLENFVSLEKDFLDQKNSHITFGIQNILKEFEELNFPENIIFDKIVIGQMGNYGSVRKILYEFNLK